MTTVSRRAFIVRAAAIGVAAALAAVPRSAGLAAGDCDLEGRDTRPHKGFASTREGSGGQCTTHAARRFDTVAPAPGVNWSGGARLWYDRAAAAGWVVSPWLEGARPGALAVWDNWDGRSDTRQFNGHVAFVEAIAEDGIEVSEMNWGASCANLPRWRTSMWGRVAYARLSWEQTSQRATHRFVGYIYPERRDPSED